jgi:transcriptional regulator with XRE-family HTH domain
MMEKKKELRKLGKNVALWRNKKGLSQDELALEAEIGRRTVNRIEVGETDVRFTTLVKIANTLGVSLKDLMDINL